MYGKKHEMAYISEIKIKTGNINIKKKKSKTADQGVIPPYICY